MIKKLNSNGTICYLYLTKTMLQLLRIIPSKAYFLFTIKNKTLFISYVEKDKIKEIDNPFVKKIKKIGTGYSIYLTKSVLELIDVDPERDNVDITIEDRVLVLKRA